MAKIATVIFSKKRGGKEGTIVFSKDIDLDEKTGIVRIPCEKVQVSTIIIKKTRGRRKKEVNASIILKVFLANLRKSEKYKKVIFEGGEEIILR